MHSRCLLATVLLLASPAAVCADVPGGPRVVAPNCPPGTHREGPYRHWSCQPDQAIVEAPPFEDPTPRAAAPEAPAAPEPTATPEPPAAELPPPAPALTSPDDVPAAASVEAEPDAVEEDPSAGDAGARPADCGCHAARRTDGGASLAVGLLIVALVSRRRRERSGAVR